jgi:competence protein CoiA
LLTAITKTGKKLCLGYDYKKETLFYLRKVEEFFCPVCSEKVMLKLGEKRIYHFAHQRGGSCREFYENESEYHMSGKLQLFQWLKRQKIPAELEFYDREIKQRPDIMFLFKGKKFALEFQCSPISEEIFTKRTEKYIQNGYTPIWILGGNHFRQHIKETAKLTNFHYLFLRKTSEGKFYIPYYSSDKGIFHLHYSIFPYSAQHAQVKKLSLQLDKINFPQLVEPKVNIQLDLKAWKQNLEKYQLNWSIFSNPRQKLFLHDLYGQRMNLFLLPPEIGLPVPHSWSIQTPSFIWQTYLYLDIFRQKHPGDIISLAEIERSFLNRKKKGQFVIRTFPQVTNRYPTLAVMEYLRILEKIGVLKSLDMKSWKFLRQIMIPLTNREKDEMAKKFYQQNGQNLLDEI